ncbi:ABC transporter ATP-binding protein [Pseudarthrobacter sp. J1738]|uniref:ABC transporter ATP-binding protein n=1 Tax=unclassified Pseudarthrobacter TaxID=2647000 RepID=UPI003D2703CC
MAHVAIPAPNSQELPHTSGAPAINVTELKVAKGHHLGSSQLDILRGLSFNVPAGQITGLLGPSGSGKTTLMRTIVGVQRPTSGRVTVLGRPAGDATLRDSVGYVTQSASVYPDISVEANVRYFGTMHGQNKTDASEAINAVGLAPYSKQLTASLSGGQLNRVSLACALVSKPQLLVLDEPTVGLDPVLRAELWERFAAMADAGTTLLISSHVMEEASHCQHLLLLRDGLLLAQLTPAELAQRGHSEDLERAFLRIIREAEPNVESQP